MSDQVDEIVKWMRANGSPLLPPKYDVEEQPESMGGGWGVYLNYEHEFTDHGSYDDAIGNAWASWIDDVGPQWTSFLLALARRAERPASTPSPDDLDLLRAQLAQDKVKIERRLAWLESVTDRPAPGFSVTEHETLGWIYCGPKFSGRTNGGRSREETIAETWSLYREDSGS